MAVYTEVSDDELAALHRQLRSGRAAVLQGHRRGRREHQLSRAHGQGPVLPDALREARGTGRPAVLPRPHGAPGQGRASIARRPCATPRAEMLRTLAGKPAALVTFLEGVWIRRPQPRHCAAVGQAMARLHHGRPELQAAARQCAGARRLAAALRALSSRAPTRWRPACRPSSSRSSTISKRTGRPTCRRASSTPTCFPTTCSSSATTLSGLIDFYFACNDALVYDVAVALNAWCFETDHSFNITKGQALLKGYQSVRPIEPARARGAAAAGARLGAALPADARLRLAAHAEATRWCSRTTRSSICAGSSSTAASARPPTTASGGRIMSGGQAGRRDLHRRRLLGKSGPRRLGRDPDLRRASQGAVAAARRRTTNNRMELMAAISALEALKKPSHVDLHTDSKYVQDGISKWIHGWKTNGWSTAAKEARQERRAVAAPRRRPRAPRGATGTGCAATPATTRTSAPTSWPAKA